MEIYTTTYLKRIGVRRVESKFTITSFAEKKRLNEKISVLTAYDYPTAKLLDGEVDVLLVGDSLGMVKLGLDDTLEVTVDDMVYHSRSVRRAAKKSFVVTDMPYLSYHISIEDSVRNAGRIIREGRANAVKLEGGRERIKVIESLIETQIPVMGHLGLTPQSVNITGGFRVQAKTSDSAERLLEDAKQLQNAGVFSIVLECIPEEIAKYITERLDIPTIGIGAGRYCDGQVLVVDDMLGITENISPRFVKRYGNMAQDIRLIAREYNSDVKSGKFPEEAHTFKLDKNELEKIERLY